MAILPIVTYNDPMLRKETAPIKELTDEITTFIQDIFKHMIRFFVDTKSFFSAKWA